MKNLLFAVFAAALLLVPASRLPAQSAPATRQVVLGAGCFWCLEAIYEQQPGVTDVTSGFAGGHLDNPSYEQVCTGSTGHAEVIRITYDPAKTSLPVLLELFWKTHDPTDGSGVAPDFGNQYRPIFLYADDEQKAAFITARALAQKNYPQPIATDLVPLKAFYPAEAYHQDYARRHPDAPYIVAHTLTKLRKLGLSLPK